MRHLGQYVTPGQVSAVGYVDPGFFGITGSSDDLTFDEAASRLLPIREAMAAIWIAMKDAARTGRLPREAMLAWNKAQDGLLALELKLYNELVRHGVKDEKGRSLPGPDTLQRTLQVGRFATSGELGTLIAVAGPLAIWAGRALTVSLAAASVYFASRAVESFNKADILRVEAQLEAMKAFREGKAVPPDALKPPAPPSGGSFWPGLGVGAFGIIALALGAFLLVRR